LFSVAFWVGFLIGECCVVISPHQFATSDERRAYLPGY
jgi:hypothetical protein